MEEKKYSGMTLNEMLFESGLLKDFDKAVKDKNRPKLIEILKKIDIENKNADGIVETIFSSPSKYGYK
jgi:hypothetical protein